MTTSPENLSSQVLKRLRLLSTSGCHLCVEALRVLEQAINFLPPEVEIIELPDRLYDYFEQKIPALILLPETFANSTDLSSMTESQLEFVLTWPFSHEDIYLFCKQGTDGRP